MFAGHGDRRATAEVHIQSLQGVHHLQARNLIELRKDLLLLRPQLMFKKTLVPHNLSRPAHSDRIFNVFSKLSARVKTKGLNDTVCACVRACVRACVHKCNMLVCVFICVCVRA